MQDIDDAMRDLDDYLERASLDSEDQTGGKAHDPKAASTKLQDLRPGALQLPASGLSTPASAPRTSAPSGAAAAGAGAGSARQQSARAAAPTAAVGYATRAGPGAASPQTPFTAAVRDLMGLPGAAPLAASRIPAPPAPTAGSRLSQEEADLLASLQRIDRNILRRGIERIAGAGAPTAAQPQPAPAAPAKVPRKASPGPTRKGSAVASGAGRKGEAAPVDLAASSQSLALRESIDKLDKRLAALKAQISGKGLCLPQRCDKLCPDLCLLGIAIHCWLLTD